MYRCQIKERKLLRCCQFIRRAASRKLVARDQKVFRNLYTKEDTLSASAIGIWRTPPVVKVSRTLYRASVSLLCATLLLGFVVACARSDGRAARQTLLADSTSGQLPSGSRAAAQAADSRDRKLVDASPLSTLEETRLRTRFIVSARAPEIVAESLRDLPDILSFADRATQRGPTLERGERWSEAAQIGLLFGSPEGKAFLSTDGGRALVRGEPSESCPSLNVAVAPTDREATDGALRACLNHLAARGSCGCRVIARGEHLLAEREEFSYAIGIGTTVLTPGREGLSLTSEERLVDGRSGARHVWVLGLDSDPFGLLQVEPDGRAIFQNSRTGETYNGPCNAQRLESDRRSYTEKGGDRRINLRSFG